MKIQPKMNPARCRLTRAEPPCCWWSGSEPAHRRIQQSDTLPHRTGPPGRPAAAGSWEEARQTAPSRWMTTPALWSWEGPRRANFCSASCYQLRCVWTGWWGWKATQGRRSPAEEESCVITAIKYLKYIWSIFFWREFLNKQRFCKGEILFFVVVVVSRNQPNNTNDRSTSHYNLKHYKKNLSAATDKGVTTT